MIVHYKIHQVSEYINWIYFFHAWGFQPKYAAIADIHGCDSCRAMWLAGFPEKERPKAAEAMQLLKEAHRMLNELDADFETHGIFRLMDANADGDNLYLDGSTRFPLLRQQAVKCKADEPFLCLSDFVRPLSSGIKDKVGAFATTVDQGIRPAVGYPSLPDQSVNFVLNELLDMKQIGISLTENGMMKPHASVSGLMFAHPASCYFSIGKIGEDQLTDYANRRGMNIEEMKKFLAANL